MDLQAIEDEAHMHLLELDRQAQTNGARAPIEFAKAMRLAKELGQALKTLGEIDKKGADIAWQRIEHHRPTQD